MNVTPAGGAASRFHPDQPGLHFLTKMLPLAARTKISSLSTPRDAIAGLDATPGHGAPRVSQPPQAPCHHWCQTSPSALSVTRSTRLDAHATPDGEPVWSVIPSVGTCHQPFA